MPVIPESAPAIGAKGGAPAVEPGPPSRRLAALDSDALEREVFERGYARVPALLSPAECAALIALYGRQARFRKTIDMTSHAYGIGEYRYFAYPLPRLVQTLRAGLYRALSPVANRMLERIGRPTRYPATLREFCGRCHEAGQLRPTPLLLRYAIDGENRLHRDLYGPVAFPLQAVFVLSQPSIDFTGGEFLLLEQRARQQSRAEALDLAQGELLVFPGYERAAPGKSGAVAVGVRHGLSRVRCGERYALGIIFHDSA